MPINVGNDVFNLKRMAKTALRSSEGKNI